MTAETPLNALSVAEESGCEHVHIGDSCVTICQPRGVEVLRTEDAGVKWCFHCRGHYAHTWEVVAETGISYYDPWGRYRCGHCGGDYTQFPGSAW